MKRQAVREIKPITFNKNDTLVVFGEVFPGGYITGLIRLARQKGMNIIYSTVGRRDPKGALRKLNTEELTLQPARLINIPLEAGFDMEPAGRDGKGPRPVDLCQSIKLNEWETAVLDKEQIEESRQNAVRAFRARTADWVDALSRALPNTGNVLIAHTMAGGVPRAKIFLPVLNRVLKGTGKRFFSSEVFWNLDLGQFCDKNFNEVTAQTYRYLIELSAPLRKKLNQTGRKIFYTAYSYHGTEVLTDQEYRWQTYSPYLQGFAKLQLENISTEFAGKGVNTCVFNVPEILTKSSAVFPGVEIPLYTLLGALKKDGGENGQKILSLCLDKLREHALQTIMTAVKNYLQSPEVKSQSVFEKWPQHNSAPQMESMLKTSKELADLHKDPAHSITPLLSEQIFNSCGRLILQEMSAEKITPVCWLGHDVIAKDIKHRAGNAHQGEELSSARK